MKILIIAGLTLSLGACITSSEFDRDQAYSKCERISEKSSRDKCIADVIRQSERQRADRTERQGQWEDDAEARELGREIAGAEKN